MGKVSKRLLLGGLGIIVCILSSCAADSDLLYLNDKVNKVEQRVGALEQGLKKQGIEDAAAIRKSLADNATETERLKREVESLKATIEELKTRKVGRLEVSQQGLLTRVSDLEADMARVRSHLKLEPLSSGAETRYQAVESAKPMVEPSTPKEPKPTTQEEIKPKPVPPVTEQRPQTGAPAIASVPTEPEKKVPSKEADPLEQGLELFRKGNTKEAIPIFDSIIKGKAKDEQKAEAYYWLGECYMAQKDYEKAILTYQDLIKGYPQSNRIPSALIKQAEAFTQINDNMSAIILYRQVIKKYPGSQEAKVAEKKVQELEKKKR